MSGLHPLPWRRLALLPGPLPAPLPSLVQCLLQDQQPRRAPIKSIEIDGPAVQPRSRAVRSLKEPAHLSTSGKSQPFEADQPVLYEPTVDPDGKSDTSTSADMSFVDAPDCLLHPFLNPPPFTLPALPFSPLESVTDAAAGRRSVRGTAVCIEQASQCVGPPSPPPLPRLSTKADSVDMACSFAGAPSALTSDRPLVPARAGNLSPDILPARPGHSSLPPPRALIARIS